MIDYDYSTPETYARHLARYISDPSTIMVRTREQFGRAPSLEECRRLRQKQSAPRRMKGIHTGRFRCGHDRSDENTVWLSLDEDACKICTEERRERNAAVMRKREEELASQKQREREERAARKAELAAIEAVRPRLISQLLSEVAYGFGLTVDDLRGPSRRNVEVCARAVVAKVLRERGLSLPQIAAKLDRACHSTVKNLLDNWETRALSNPHMITVYRRVR